jgi:hypothetical protein
VLSAGLRRLASNGQIAINRPMSNDEFALEKSLLPLFRKQCVITIANNLIDPQGFNFKKIPGRSYKIFAPVFPEEKVQLTCLLEPHYPVIYFHMLAVRLEALDVIGDEYLFIRAYRVGHTLEMETITVVVEAQVKGRVSRHRQGWTHRR